MKTLWVMGSLWFGLAASVTRRTYVITGVALMVIKVIVDNSMAYVATGRPWSLGAYLAPSMLLKTENEPTPQWMLIAMVVFALPFVWIGVSMSVRRAADAGLSPFVGLLFLVPIINWLTM